MKGLIPIIVVAAVLLGGGFYLMTNLEGRLDTAQFEAALAKQRLDVAQQVTTTAMSPDDKVAFDRGQLMNWHRNEIAKIFEKHPKKKDADGFMESMEKKAAEGKKDKAKTAMFRERYDWLKSVWETKLKAGDYKPVLSQYKNGVRYDITNLSSFRPPEGGPKSLRMDLIIWGAPKDQFQFGPIEIQFVREIEQPGRKPKRALAKIEGAGPPNVFHPAGTNPEPYEWIPDWPPLVGAGYYVGLPLFAPDATKFSLKLDVALKSKAGTQHPIELKWENITIENDWKAEDGSKWEGVEQEASEEELKAAGITL